jgi:hypothetical protein
MRTSVKFVAACAGAPIAALCVGAATASADTNSTQQTTNGGLAVSAGGNTLLQFGNSTATTTGPSLAVAFNDSDAEANGIGNFAFAANGSTVSATGNFNDVHAISDSTARVNNGSNNHVWAIDRSTAEVNGGNNNVVMAINRSTAEVNGGDNNIVTALCGGSAVSAQSNRIVTSAPCLMGSG